MSLAFLILCQLLSDSSRNLALPQNTGIFPPSSAFSSQKQNLMDKRTDKKARRSIGLSSQYKVAWLPMRQKIYKAELVRFPLETSAVENRTFISALDIRQLWRKCVAVCSEGLSSSGGCLRTNGGKLGKWRCESERCILWFDPSWRNKVFEIPIDGIGKLACLPNPSRKGGIQRANRALLSWCWTISIGCEFWF